MEIKFYGTRGSLPSPINNKMEYEKIRKVVLKALAAKPYPRDIDEWFQNLPFNERGTFGGNTTCCVVRSGGLIIVLDLGSGLREFGKEILPEMFQKKGLPLFFLMSHVHWDHIQGFPFFAPLFISRQILPQNKWTFFGGTKWQKALQEVLAGQMEPPLFPVEWDKIIAEGPSMEFKTVHHNFTTVLSNELIERCIIRVTAFRLNHPNETYGWRIECATTEQSGNKSIEKNKKVFAFASDTEPYACGPDPVLLELSKDADVLYLDGQFTYNDYIGKTGVPRLGWGHGYDIWCGEVAKAANVKKLMIGHHDIASSDEKIMQIVENVKTIFPNAVGAYDGMEIKI